MPGKSRDAWYESGAITAPQQLPHVHHARVEHTALSIFALSHFRTENRMPLFLKML
jgi:hypothetical protein